MVIPCEASIIIDERVTTRTDECKSVHWRLAPMEVQSIRMDDEIV